MADILGIVAGTLGIISFILGQTPSNSQSQTSVELTVGYARNKDDMGGLGGAEGNFGHVYLFSPVNSMIGDKDISGHQVDTGVSYQFKVDTTGEQPEYLEVTATNDAVCMSWMAVTYGSNVADGTYALFGDFFKYCDISGSVQEWYYGNVFAGYDDNNNRYYPLCGWLDKDHTNGHAFASLKARMPVFKHNDAGDNTDKNYLCRPPSLEFGTDTNVIDKREHARDVKNVKRYINSGTRGDTSLVTSTIPSQSAKELCESPNSSGPDFISLLEGLHCDMTTREVRPLCSVHNLSVDCFDLDVARNAISGLINGNLVDKVFSRIVEYTDDD